MRLSALLVLSLAGCSLYFDPGEQLPPEQPLPGDPMDEPKDPFDPSDPFDPCAAPCDPGCIPPPPDEPPATSCGSPEVHILSVYETSSNHTVAGEASVRIDRPGRHILVLSAYEQTNWHVTLGRRARISAVHLIGYESQTVDLLNVPVTRDTGCGYSYPYNGGGCDTNVLFDQIEARVGGLTTFHGCYQASQWTLSQDGSATSNCNTAAGYEVDELLAPCLSSAPKP